MYLRGLDSAEIPVYASPARHTDYSTLPPAYTFVGDGEPFYAETMAFVDKLKKAGVPAEVDVYHTDMHAFDMLEPEWEISRAAAESFDKHFAYALEHYHN